MIDHATAWSAIVGLGVFHGINPAMGWLFAVALGMHRGDRREVLRALVPIAAGHALAIAALLGVFALVGRALPADQLRLLGGVLLIAWALHHGLRGHRHPVRVGMTAGAAGLCLWSFLMASAHGAGAMLLPPLLAMTPPEVAGDGSTASALGSPGLALMAVGAHTFAMLTTTGLVAVLVYEYFGVAFLRRGWVNIDVVWTLALTTAGGYLLLA